LIYWLDLTCLEGDFVGRHEDQEQLEPPAVKSLTCQEVLDQLSEYLDDDARAELVEGVDVHLGKCDHCRVEVDTLRRTIEIYRCDEKVVLPVKLSEKLQRALDQLYRANPDQGRGNL
jgi:anti-sigma factor RsiW